MPGYVTPPPDAGGFAPRGRARAKTEINLSPVPRLSLNVQEACAALGVSWDVWRQHIEPDVRLVRVGARKLIPTAELERWLAEHAATVLERR